jgi:hypothetical protein
MENEPVRPPTRDEASLALAGALGARRRLAESLVLPSYFFSSLGVVIAAQLATSAVGLTSQDRRGWLVVVSGWIALVVVAGIQLARFRRLNGVRVAGLTHRVVLGTGNEAAVSYGTALAAGIWSALEGVPWLVLCSSLAGGVAYAWSGQRWWQAYRGDPATHGRRESRVYLAGASVLALVGAVLLLTAG